MKRDHRPNVALVVAVAGLAEVAGVMAAGAAVMAAEVVAGAAVAAAATEVIVAAEETGAIAATAGN
jgi:hypothetical protein